MLHYGTLIRGYDVDISVERRIMPLVAQLESRHDVRRCNSTPIR